MNLQTVDQVKYLGDYFSAATGFHPTFDDLHHKACAARAIIVRNYGRLDCDRIIWLPLQMFRMHHHLGRDYMGSGTSMLRLDMSSTQMTCAQWTFACFISW